MSANNRKCGVGVAFNAKVGGKRYRMPLNLYDIWLNEITLRPPPVTVGFLSGRGGGRSYLSFTEFHITQQIMC